MPRASNNPFRDQPQSRDITLTFRVTKAEHDAIVATVGTKRGAIKDLIRELLATEIERRRGVKR